MESAEMTKFPFIKTWNSSGTDLQTDHMLSNSKIIYTVQSIVDASIVFQIIAIYGFILKYSNCDIAAYL